MSAAVGTTAKPVGIDTSTKKPPRATVKKFLRFATGADLAYMVWAAALQAVRRQVSIPGPLADAMSRSLSLAAHSQVRCIAMLRS